MSTEPMSDDELLMRFGPCWLCGGPQHSFIEEIDGVWYSGIRCTRCTGESGERPSVPRRLWNKFGLGGLIYLGLAAGIVATIACMWVLAAR
jgi:hypothetical protein